MFHSGASVYIMNAHGTNARVIATGADSFNADEYPSLTPDGTFVVFDRINEIDAIGVDGMGQRYVVQNWTTIEETPTISPDGYNVAFAVSCNSTKQIAVVPFAGYARDPCMVTFATSPQNGTARRPAWGPENYLAYERGSATDAGAQGASIAITAGPGSEPCDVVGGPWQSGNPSWAPLSFKPQ